MSVEPATRVGYAAGLLRFTQFCDEFGVGEEIRMPASDTLLAGFVACNAGKVASAQHWIDGLQLWHKVNGAPWCGGTQLAAALVGARKLAPSSSRREPRPPVSFEHLEALRLRLNLHNIFDAAVYAA
ncbi:hypothetical protein OF83DRAFT_1073028, partial [Amylostereum chailletii]